MLKHFGDRDLFAVEVGPIVHEHPQGLVVDLWLSGRELCCDDNHVFVPQFCNSVEATITWLLSDYDRSLPYPELSPEENHRKLFLGEREERSRFSFMEWGPTTDNQTAMLFRRGQNAIITVEFRREAHPRPEELGRVFVAELSDRYVLRSLHQAVCELRNGMMLR
jgi:hypothetical protein